MYITNPGQLCSHSVPSKNAFPIHIDAPQIKRLYVSDVSVPHVLLFYEIISLLYELHVIDSLPVALPVTPLQLEAIQPATAGTSLCCRGCHAKSGRQLGDQQLCQ